MTKTVIVGSKNPVKIEGVRQGFEKMFPDEDFEFIGYGAKSGVPDQPMGSEETLKGAYNRAEDCRKSHPEADFFCGQEGGIFQDHQEDYGTVAWTVILDRDGNLGKGLSSLHILPPKVMELVHQGYELGTADDMVFQQTNSKQQGGSIGILTDGIYTRTHKMVEAVICALIPHKNPELYFTNHIKKAG